MQFFNWSADYLRWLWYHEGDASLPKLALFALKPLLQYDAEVSIIVHYQVLKDIFVPISFCMMEQYKFFTL